MVKCNWKGPVFPTDRVFKNIRKALEVRVCIEQEFLNCIITNPRSWVLGSASSLPIGWLGRVGGAWRLQNILAYQAPYLQENCVASAIRMRFSEVCQLRTPQVLYIETSRVLARVRARALRAPVFLSSLTQETGRYAPPRPSQLRYFLFIFPKIIN